VSVGQMSVGQMIVGQTIVGRMIVGLLNATRNNELNFKGRNYTIRILI
jgi:hypothetical protein